ncbi:hypothetical protein ASF99_09640 [Exiguobacterium sp. Leaf187]|nr:hypothetical protein ASF99_09640 [Exiguobacterium sp. Leaf187]
MSKYHKSSIRLVLIVLVTVTILYYGFNFEIGYGIIFLIAAVGCTIYLNFKAAKKEKSEKKIL